MKNIPSFCTFLWCLDWWPSWWLSSSITGKANKYTPAFHQSAYPHGTSLSEYGLRYSSRWHSNLQLIQQHEKACCESTATCASTSGRSAGRRYDGTRLPGRTCVAGRSYVADMWLSEHCSELGNWLPFPGRGPAEGRAAAVGVKRSLTSVSRQQLHSAEICAGHRVTLQLVHSLTCWSWFALENLLPDADPL